MKRKTKKAVTKTKRTSEQGFLMVRVTPDNANNVKIETARNGRTTQGEVNVILKDYYQSKWEAPRNDVALDPRGLRNF